MSGSSSACCSGALLDQWFAHAFLHLQRFIVLLAKAHFEVIVCQWSSNTQAALQRTSLTLMSCYTLWLRVHADDAHKLSSIAHPMLARTPRWHQSPLCLILLARRCATHAASDAIWARATSVCGEGPSMVLINSPVWRPDTSSRLSLRRGRRT